MGIKKNKITPKIKHDDIIKNNCPDSPSISFEHLTDRKDFNLSNLEKYDKREWESALYERLVEITQQKWTYWQSLPKQTGLETIEVKEIKFSPKGYNFSPDEKVIIFRFNQQKGRIVGIKKNCRSIFYIIGIEIKHDAYNHG